MESTGPTRRSPTTDRHHQTVTTRFRTKRVIGWAILVVFALLAIVVLSPVFLPVVFQREWAFNRILSEHKAHFKNNNGNEFLYLSWFPTGNPKYAQEYIAFIDGTRRTQRNLYNFAVEGCVGTMQPKVLEGLSRTSDLPGGLPSPHSVPLDRLLVASHQERGRWVTRCYDLDHLPSTVEGMLNVAASELSLETPSASLNWHPPLPRYRFSPRISAVGIRSIGAQRRQ